MNDKIKSIDSARNLAVAIISDINLYFEDRIHLGLQNDNLFIELANEINDGLELYKSKVSVEIFDKMSLFQRELVDSLFYNKGKKLFKF